MMMMMMMMIVVGVGVGGGCATAAAPAVVVVVNIFPTRRFISSTPHTILPPPGVRLLRHRHQSFDAVLALGRYKGVYTHEILL